MILIHSETRKRVTKGDKLVTFRGEEVILNGWRQPHKPSSTGAVFVCVEGQPGDFQYYPSVVDCEFVCANEFERKRLNEDGWNIPEEQVMVRTITLKSYGKGEPIDFRNPANVDEMDRWCEANTHIMVLSNKNTAVNAKVNGKVKRWKKDRSRIEVPLKYGLRECVTFTQHDIDRILIPIADAS